MACSTRSTRILAAKSTLTSIVLATLVLAASSPASAVAWLDIAGEDEELGIFDPSLEYLNVGGYDVGNMAYSRVREGENSAWSFVDTRVAQCIISPAVDWTFAKAVNTSYTDTVTIDSVARDGVWKYEVPTIIWDPTDSNSAKRWKLFYLKIFHEDDECGPHALTHSYIGMKTASAPDGTWSSETILLGGPDCAYSPAVTLDSNFDSDYVMYNVPGIGTIDGGIATEPSALYYNGVIYLAFNCLFAATPYHKVMMIKSTDHGANWEHVSTLIDQDDASELGEDMYNAVELFQASVSPASFGLLASPAEFVSGPPCDGELYNGFTVFPFSSFPSTLDFENASANFPRPEESPHAGAVGYHIGNDVQGGGVLMSVYLTGEDQIVEDQIYNIFELE